ncbi:MAG: hypothetical protein AAGA88_08115 [Pseudomonadota bacterium]
MNAAPRPDRQTSLLTDRVGAETFAQHTISTIQDLTQILSDETDLLRDAKYKEAMALSERKADLVNSYARAMTTLGMERRSMQTLAPDSLDLVLTAHRALSAAAETNLPVVERARDTSRRVIDGITDVARRKASGPATYSADGAGAQQNRKNLPLALNSSF